MLFCPKCGSLLRPKEEKKGKTSMQCSNSKCSFVKKEVENLEIREKVTRPDDKVEVISDEEAKMLPLADADCPDCKHTKAYYWLVQTRAGDEPETKFLKCEKCGHTWRDYS